jgi:hypothetical protein
MPPVAAPFPSEMRQRLLTSTQLRFHAGLAGSSRLTYDTRTQAYVHFCRQMGWEAFPLNTSHVATYFEYYVSYRHRSPTSLPGIFCCLNHTQQSLGHPKILARDDFYLTQVTRGIRRANPDQARRPKYPLTCAVIRRLADRVERPSGQHASATRDDATTDRLALQLITMCLTGHDGLLRTGELLRLRWADLTFLGGTSEEQRLQDDGTPVLELPRATSQQNRPGILHDVCLTIR